MSVSGKYFEEFILNREVGWPRQMGCRVVEANPENRELGSVGRRDEILTQPITLTKGVRIVTYKASPQKPLKVTTMLNKLGRW